MFSSSSLVKLIVFKKKKTKKNITHTEEQSTKSAIRQPYYPAAQDWLPTEAKQGWAWSVPGWETSWEN